MPPRNAPRKLHPLPVAEAAAPALSALPLARVAPDGRVVLRIAGLEVTADVDPSVDVAVLHTAARRGERVIAQHEDGRWLVLGALRASATPGVDEMEEVIVRGRRLHLEGTHEITVRSGSASLVLRAQGYVETFASDITTRARAVHKLVGRVLRLN
jgi:hypothetical protein